MKISPVTRESTLNFGASDTKSLLCKSVQETCLFHKKIEFKSA